MTMKIVPVELKEANAFIDSLHRHHKPVQGHRFSIGVEKDGTLVGVATIGRPVARLTPAKEVLEVTRLCTNGTKNACSSLYSAAARIGKEMGYKKIQSFILDTENGSSLKASGWVFESVSPGGQWKHTDGKPRRTDQPTCPKHKYVKILNT
jgi:antitoxin (DNA-binding transcriptional repressor) of toxin-antitoxin stability system